MGLQGTDLNRGPEGAFSKDKTGFSTPEATRLPSPLLIERHSTGPWTVIGRPRFLEIRRTAGAPLADVHRNPEAYPIAWRGSDAALSVLLVERFNGYEMAREFPPKQLD